MDKNVILALSDNCLSYMNEVLQYSSREEYIAVLLQVQKDIQKAIEDEAGIL